MRLILSAGMQFVDIADEKVSISTIVSSEVFDHFKTALDMYTNNIELDASGVADIFNDVWLKGGLIRSHAARMYRSAVAWLLLHEVIHAMPTAMMFEELWNAVIKHKFRTLPGARRHAKWMEEFRADGLATVIMMGAIATRDNPSLGEAQESDHKAADQELDSESSADPMFYGRNTAFLGALTALEVLQFCESYLLGIGLSKTLDRALIVAEFATHPPAQLRKEALWALSRAYGGLHDHLVKPWFSALWAVMAEYADSVPVPE